MTAKALGIDSEDHLFYQLSKSKDEIPSIISRRVYNDCRKLTVGLCKELRKRIIDSIARGEDCFIIARSPSKSASPLVPSDAPWVGTTSTVPHHTAIAPHKGSIATATNSMD